ncbi:MAG: hypothetical protein JW776_10875 [Candidatus Lokiarchaeota archaeon]|nr:hypothetical protein [Candidatus Lokiarchaeota archaeon]
MKNSLYNRSKVFAAENCNSLLFSLTDYLAEIDCFTPHEKRRMTTEDVTINPN